MLHQEIFYDCNLMYFQTLACNPLFCQYCYINDKIQKRKKKIDFTIQKRKDTHIFSLYAPFKTEGPTNIEIKTTKYFVHL